MCVHPNRCACVNFIMLRACVRYMRIPGAHSSHAYPQCGRRYELRAGSRGEMLAWVDAVDAAIVGASDDSMLELAEAIVGDRAVAGWHRAVCVRAGGS